MIFFRILSSDCLSNSNILMIYTLQPQRQSDSTDRTIKTDRRSEGIVAPLHVGELHGPTIASALCLSVSAISP